MAWPPNNQIPQTMPIKVHINPNFRGKPNVPGIGVFTERPAGIHFNPHWKPRSDSANTLKSYVPANDTRDVPTSSLPSSQRRTIHINPKVIGNDMSQSISTLLQQQSSSDIAPEPASAFKDCFNQKIGVCQSSENCATTLTSNLDNCEVNSSSKVSRLICSPAQLNKIRKNSSSGKSPVIRSAKVICSKYKYLTTSITNETPQNLHKYQNCNPVSKPAPFVSRLKYVKKLPDSVKTGFSPKNHIVSRFKLVKRVLPSTNSTLSPRQVKVRKIPEIVKNIPEHTIKSRYKLSKGIAPKPTIDFKNRSLTNSGKCRANSRYKFVRTASLQRSPLKRKSPRGVKSRYKVDRGTGNEDSRLALKFPATQRCKPATYEARSPFGRRNTWLRQDLQATRIVTSNRKLLRIGRRPENKNDKVRKAKLLRIGGVFYRSTRTTLTRSSGPASASPKGEKNHHSRKGQVLAIRGSKFVLDKSGRTLQRLTPNKTPISRIHIGGVTFVPFTENTLVRSRVHETRNLVSQAKQRSIAVLTSKLRKNNQPCLIYQRIGKCRLHDEGRCLKVHDPKKIAICNDFVNGKCLKSSAECRLSHDVGPQKMPTCHFFLEGCCVRDPCPYSHVKLNHKAAVCRDFLSGYCSAGEKCKKRHVFLCPEYEETKRCSKGKYCSYRHAGEVEQRGSGAISRVGGDRVPRDAPNATSPPQEPTTSTDPQDTLTRYYVKNEGKFKAEPVCLLPERSKLGHLPGFIPL